MKPHANRIIVISTTLMVAFAVSGCQRTGGPDLTPIGNGLAIVGLGIVLAAFIRVLGDQLCRPKLTSRKECDEEPQ